MDTEATKSAIFSITNTQRHWYIIYTLYRLFCIWFQDEIVKAHTDHWLTFYLLRTVQKLFYLSTGYRRKGHKAVPYATASYEHYACDIWLTSQIYFIIWSRGEIMSLARSGQRHMHLNNQDGLLSSITSSENSVSETKCSMDFEKVGFTEKEIFQPFREWPNITLKETKILLYLFI